MVEIRSFSKQFSPSFAISILVGNANEIEIQTGRNRKKINEF